MEPMESSIKFDTVKSGWSIVYIEGLPVIFSEKIFSPKIDFDLANSAHPGEMPHYVAFHPGLHCLPKTCLGVSVLQRGNDTICYWISVFSLMQNSQIEQIKCL